MRLLFATILSGMLSTHPGAADVWHYGAAECNELWFMRNLIMGSFAPFAPFQSFFGSRPNTTDEK